MSLGRVTEKLSEIYCSTRNFIKADKKYVEAAGFFLSTRTFDVITSNLVMSERGNWGEVAPVTKHFMNLYGPNLGLIVENATIGGLVILASYYLNKKNLKAVSGNNLLKGVGIVSLGIAAINFFEYFGVPVLYPILKPIDSLLEKLL